MTWFGKDKQLTADEKYRRIVMSSPVTRVGIDDKITAETYGKKPLDELPVEPPTMVFLPISDMSSAIRRMTWGELISVAYKLRQQLGENPDDVDVNKMAKALWDWAQEI